MQTGAIGTLAPGGRLFPLGTCWKVGAVAGSPRRTGVYRISARLDWLASDRHSLFFRYSHDQHDGFAPPTGAGRLPSNWADTRNWSDQAVASLISTFTSELVNEFRFSYCLSSVGPKLRRL
ncbi:MAG: hypothetical protein P8020_21600 [Acidobacteriota bacterium]